ncbi:MAG: choice-of-anchor D domain-containing protein, partial [Gemmatimonadota bacterium]
LAAADGSLYIADEQFNRVRLVAPDGAIRTVVGSGLYGSNGSGRSSLKSALGIANSLALGPDGTLWLVDLASQQIRFVDGDGALRTFASPASPLFASVSGPFAPNGIDVVADGRVYVADRGTNVVWEIDPDGKGRRAAGNGTRGYAGDGRPSAQGELADPRAVAVGPDGTIWIADTGNRRVRAVREGVLSTAAGNGTEAPWSGAAPALEVGLKPVDVAVDGAGRLLVLDELGQRVLRLEGDGTLVSVLELGAGAEGAGLSVAPDGRVVVGDRGHRTVVAAKPGSGRLQVVAGNGTARASGDGQAAVNASLYQPFAMAWGPDGSLYLADRLNHLVRRVLPDGTLERVAGTGAAGYGGDGGPALMAELDQPSSLTVDRTGRVYVADENNHRVRRIAGDGTITTVAGTGHAGFAGDGGPAVAAQLAHPGAVALDEAGRLLIADSGNGRIRRVGADGAIATVAGNGGTGPMDDGGPALKTALPGPADVRADGRGSFYVADAGAHRVYRVDAAGYPWVVAGTGQAGAGIDGTAARSAALNRPLGVEPDGAGGVFIADAGNQRLVHVDGSGVLRVLETGDLGAPARLTRSADGAGLLVADIALHRILQVPVARRLAPLSQRLRVADADWAYEAAAAVAVPNLLDVVYDPVAGRTYLTHAAGVEVLDESGARQSFAEFAAPAYSAAAVSGAYGRGLVLGVPAGLGHSQPLTLIEPGSQGGSLYFNLSFAFDGTGEVAAAPDNGLFLQQDGRVLRLPPARLLNIPGFPRAVGGRGVEPGGLELYVSLPSGPARIAAAESGLYIALVSSRTLLRARDLDGNGAIAGPAELERLADLPAVPRAVAALGDQVFAATDDGRVYRVSGSGQVALVAAGFAPQILSLSAGPAGSLVVLEGDAAGGRVVRLRPAAPSLAVWPEALDFGAAAVGQPAAATVVLRNTGRAALTLSPEVPGGAAVSGLGTVELAAGQVLEVPVTLSASGRGALADEVLWRDAARGEVLARLPVRIQGIGPAAVLPDALDLGAVWVGGARTQYATLTNAGELPLEIVGLDLAPFGEAPPAAAAGTARLLSAALGPFTAEVPAGAVPPGGRVRVQVRMSPTARTSAAALLRVFTSDPEQPVRTVALSGSGGRAQLQVDRVDLGTAPVGGSARQTLELTNLGEVDLRMESLLTGTLQLIVTPRRLLIPAGQTGQLELVFRPAAHGPVEGSLTFFTNDPTERQWSLPFAGQGVSQVLRLGSPSHTFATTSLGSTEAWEVSLTNYGSRPIHIVGARIQGRQFQITGWPQQLGAGETAAVVVTFAPLRPGLAAATLVLETDLAEAPRLQVALAGRGRVSTAVQLVAPEGPVGLWPGELLEVPVRVEGAEALRGLVLDLGLPPGFELDHLEVPATSLLSAGGEALTVYGTGASGQPQVGVSMSGRYAAEGVSGSGLVGRLALRPGQVPAEPVAVALTAAVARSAAGVADTLALPAPALVTVVLKGDLDGDGALTQADVARLAAAAGGPQGRDQAAFDLDGDGRITGLDVEMLLQHLEPAARALAAAGPLPAAVRLSPPYPNPFNAETVLVYELPEAAPAQLVVYNLLGQPVRQLVDAQVAAGTHVAVWDGRDDQGQRVTSGTYFLVLRSGEKQLIHRALLLQ